MMVTKQHHKAGKASSDSRCHPDEPGYAERPEKPQHLHCCTIHGPWDPKKKRNRFRTVRGLSSPGCFYSPFLHTGRWICQESSISLRVGNSKTSTDLTENSLRTYVNLYMLVYTEHNLVINSKWQSKSVTQVQKNTHNVIFWTKTNLPFISNKSGELSILQLLWLTTVEIPHFQLKCNHHYSQTGTSPMWSVSGLPREVSERSSNFIFCTLEQNQFCPHSVKWVLFRTF